MPIRQRGEKWYWGKQGPFDSRKQAEEVAQAAHSSGYVKKEDGGGSGFGGDAGAGTVFSRAKMASGEGNPSASRIGRPAAGCARTLSRWSSEVKVQAGGGRCRT